MGILDYSSALVRSEHGIQHNAQVKLYPDGSAVVSVYDRALMRESGWEAREARGRAMRRGSGTRRRRNIRGKFAASAAKSARSCL